MIRVFGVLAAALWASMVGAVSPQVWQQTSEAQFAKGEFEGTAVSSLGEISLAPAVQILLKSERAPQVVSALAVGDSRIYAASGSDNTIRRVSPDGSVSTFACPKATIITALLWTGQDLLAGASGSGAGVYRLGPDGTAKRLWSAPDVASVWALARAPDGFYAATGAKGGVYHVGPDGTGSLLYRVDSQLAANILCLSVGPDGLLYAGTDKSGLVLRIDPATKLARVILAAEENEVSAIIPDLAGGLYVATSDAAKATPEGDGERASKPSGRTDSTTRTSQPASSPAWPATAAATREHDEDKGAGGESDDPGDIAPGASASTDPDEPTEAFLDRAERASKPAGAASKASHLDAIIGDEDGEGPGDEEPPMDAQIQRIRRQIRSASRPSGRPPSGKAGAQEGNAVYYIRPDGMVNTLFRREVTILSMLRLDDHLLLGTGNGGVIYSVGLDGQEVFQIADTSASQITALAQGPDGQVVFATANPGSIGALAAAPAPSGTFRSDTHDAQQVARWGSIRVGRLGQGKVRVATRTGNTPKPLPNVWSDWSAGRDATGELMSIPSPPGRFLQYRLELEGDQDAGPIVQYVEVIYQLANLPPAISGVRVEPAMQKEREGPDQAQGPKPFRRIRIQADDPNQDDLRYELFLRQADGSKWIKLTEDLEEPQYVWDTRTVADGEYDLRVRVSDDRSNPPESALSASQVHNFVTVDNTPPIVDPPAVKIHDPQVRVSAAVADAASRIVAIAYSVDSQEEWVPLLPVDGIADSRSEKIEFAVKDLEPGPHRIAIRALDEFSNAGYATAGVTIEP